MYAAANHPGGFGGVPQSVGKEFVASGKAKATLPERKKSKNAKAAKLYGKPAARSDGSAGKPDNH